MGVFHHFKFTPLSGVAALSVALLVGVAAWQGTVSWRPAPMSSAEDVENRPTGDPLWEQEMTLLGLATSSALLVDNGADPVKMIAPQVLAQLIGKYTSLIEAGLYTPEAGAAAAAEIAPNIRALVVYSPYEKSAIKKTDDLSYERLLKYREDMQVALKPLLANTRAEYAIYGSYLESGDPANLEELLRVAKNYSDAAENAVGVEVPADAVYTHLEMVNALAHFAATLRSMAVHADDPVGSLALLRTYNDVELDVVTSFDAFAKYGRSKMP